MKRDVLHSVYLKINVCLNTTWTSKSQNSPGTSDIDCEVNAVVSCLAGVAASI